MMENSLKSCRDELLPGLSIIHGNHLEDLRDVAVHWIKKYPLDVLESEQFIVQSNGMAQWLKLALAGDDGCGISAGLEFLLPGRWVWTAYRSILGETIPTESPYDRERLVWRFFSILPTLSTDELFLPLNRFLENDKDQQRQYQLACRLGNLFDQYQVYRADWLEQWAKGRDRVINSRGQLVDIKADHLWQAELWRRLRAGVSYELQNVGRSDLHQNFLRKSKHTDVRPPMLPPRVIVFGISSLPKQVLETLDAVSGFCQVLFFVNNPCRYFWADIIEDRELLSIEHARHLKKESVPVPLDPDLIHCHANPLLAAWGKQGRDYIGLVYGYDTPETYRNNFAEIDLFRDVIPPGTRGTLLQQIQQAVLDLDPLVQKDEPTVPVAASDRSISFQVAHSRQREVEILQDQLLYSFETLDNLLPRDIVVMTPDIGAYAPHIEAVFGNLSSDDPRYIPFTVADHPGKKSVPLLRAIEKLLHLPDLPMTPRDFMDLLEVSAFQKRFGFTQADLPRILQWIRGAGISLGLNKEHRTLFGFPPDLDQNSWAFGLDRMLLGYAVGKNEAWNGIEPFDEIGGLDAHLVGRIAEVVERLEALWTKLQTPARPELWSLNLRSTARDFFEPMDSGERLILLRMDQVLDEWLENCTEAELDQELTLTVVRAFFLEKMTLGGMSQRFLAGMVNFGTLMPMRAIPFRVVCLLGMNDGDFPRSFPPLDFDMMAQKGMYRPGDRSKREDDRYLFLEALLSAREKLYLSHVGRDVRDNAERMPSVLVGQLRDYIDAGWHLESGSLEPGLAAHLTTVHPLQPFGISYFTGPGSDHDPEPGSNPGASLFTYSHEWRTCLGHRAVHDPEPPLSIPLPEQPLTLGVLAGFMKNPVKFFYTHFLGIRFDDIDLDSLDHEPFALDFLAPFGPGYALLEAGLRAGNAPELYPGDRGACGVETAVVEEAERLTRTGQLPMAGFGTIAAKSLTDPVLAMLTRYDRLKERWPLSHDPREISLKFDIEGSPESWLEDWLNNLVTTDISAAHNDALTEFSRTEFYPRNILGKNRKDLRLYPMVPLWIGHLAGCAMGMSLTSHLISPDTTFSFDPLDPEDAALTLMEIIKTFRRGFTRPLPATAKTGLAYVAALVDNDQDKAKSAAAKAYQGDGYNSKGELGYDPYLQRTFPDFDALWQDGENLFKDLAVTLYSPMVSAGEVRQ